MTNDKKISMGTKIFYGAGVGYAIVDQIFAQWILYFYFPPASSGLKVILPSAYLAVALGISRLVDVITDPLVGYFSDKISTPWGRRIPFIAIGTIPLSFVTVAFFYPPTNSVISTFIYLVIIGSLFFTFYTVVGGPYNSLIPEIAHTREDRLSLSTWQSIFRLIYVAIAMILPGSLIFILGKGDTLSGIRQMVIVLSLLAIITSCFTVFGVKETKYSLQKSLDINLKATLKILINNKNFIFYLFGLLFYFIGFNTLRATMNYYVEDIMGYGKVAITVSSALLFLVAALFFYPTNLLVKKFGYRKIMLSSLIILSILSFFLFGLGKFVNIKLGFVIFALIGFPVAGSAFIFPPAMLSEIGDKISTETGHHIEGVCFGIQGFFLKLAFLISIVVLPMILSQGGDIVQKNGIYMTTIFSIIAFIISFFFYFKYKE